MPPAELLDLRGRVAIVTGGAMGNGRGIALALAGCGADVVVADIDAAAAGAVVDEMRAMGRDPLFVRTDVASVGDIGRMVDAVIARYGRIHILVNNAGILTLSLGEGGPSLADTTEESWTRMMDINLKGAVFCAKAVLPHMVRQHSGVIINIGSSGSANGGLGNETVEYDISKAGMECLTKALARFHAGDGVRVNSISPGVIDTPMHAARQAEVRAMEAAIPLGRLGTPEDIGGVAAWLASDLSAYVTGQAIHVNGGLRMVS